MGSTAPALYLGKFSIGAFIHDAKRGRVGLVLSTSTETELAIGWFDGTKQVVCLEPKTTTETKRLRRAARFKLLSLTDFQLDYGIPSRVRKASQINDPQGGNPSRMDLIVESLILPGQQLDEKQMILSLAHHYKVEHVLDAVDVESRRHGDTLQTLVRFWL